MDNWKVSYIDVRALQSRHGFYKQSTVVRASSRSDAIAKVKAVFGPPNYGQHRASKTQDAACSILFA